MKYIGFLWGFVLVVSLVTKSSTVFYTHHPNCRKVIARIHFIISAEQYVCVFVLYAVSNCPISDWIISYFALSAPAVPAL